MINIVAIAYVLICIGSGIDLPAPEISEPVIYESTAPEFSDNNLDLLCREVYAEAGGDGTDSQKGVTTVIINRIMSPTFPEDLEDVLYQSGQFAQNTQGYYQQPKQVPYQQPQQYPGHIQYPQNRGGDGTQGPTQNS